MFMNKLYFYENKIDLDFIFNYHTFVDKKNRNFIVLTGQSGYKKTIEQLQGLDEHIIYSNYPCILNNFYDNETGQYEVYIMLNNKPIHIQCLIDEQDLKENNIENIYRNGGFNTNERNIN